MSLTLAEFKTLFSQIKSKIEESIFIFCTEIGKRKFIINFQKESLHYNILFCFQEPFLRFHLIEDQYQGVDTAFVHQINQYLKKFILKKCLLLNDDRILQLVFEKEEIKYLLVGEFFPKKPNFYLLNDQNKIILSLNPSKKSYYQSPENPFSQSTPSLMAIDSHIIENFYQEKEDVATFNKEKTSLQSALHKKIKNLENRKEKCLKELSQALSWQAVHHNGMLLKANLYRLKKGMSDIILNDWEKEGKEVIIPLDSLLAPYQQIEKLFKKSKKLKAGVKYLQCYLEKINKEIFTYQELEKVLSELITLEDLQQFKQKYSFHIEIKHKEQIPSLPYREFVTAKGLKLWVGKSAKDNDKLTFSLAHGSDWWFHIKGFSGSHVILKVNKNQEPDSESIKDAMQLALYYSKAKKEGKAEIIFAQRKFVQRIGKGKVGQVHVSKHKTSYITLDEKRYKELQERN